MTSHDTSVSPSVRRAYGAALDVPCPSCSVGPGAFCGTWPAYPGGLCGLARKPHAARVKAAQGARRTP